ncbi:D-ala-D-ala dipeptidase [Gammaproteobacteria bacterium]|nr:D-ala-D-ala dipeptidase [Gammaproteobacteria bacterium]
MKESHHNLLELTQEKDNIVIDLYYADTRNFTNKAVYKNKHCFAHQDLLEKFNIAKLQAQALGLIFIVFDAYRPPAAQFILWDHTPDPNFLANPYLNGSAHSRGTAIDLNLIDAITKEPLDMGTKFDEFTEKSWHGNLDISNQAQKNRLLLLGIMTAAGFDWYSHEWWHYQLFGAKNYPLIEDHLLGQSNLMGGQKS